MTKDQLIAAVARKSGNSQRATAEVIDSLVATMQDILFAGDSLTFINFGKLSTRVRPGGKRRNPRTGETVQVPDAYYPHMAFSESFKKRVRANKPVN